MKFVDKCKSEDYALKYSFRVPIDLKKPHGQTKLIEGAFIHLPQREEGKPKSILCLSSQVGCFYDCNFCENSGKKYYRSLIPNEIEEQISMILGHDDNLEKIKEEGAVEHAFMGIGEPLFRNNVVQAIHEHKAYVPDTRFGIATVGARCTIDRILEYEKSTGIPFKYPIRLELSLHFPVDYERNLWIGSGLIKNNADKILNIKRMFKEADNFQKRFDEKITVNYMIIDGVNNTIYRLEELVNLLEPRKDKYYVKIMQANLTSSLDKTYQKALLTILNSRTKRTYNMEEFKEQLEKRGIHATLFKSKGIDIRAGCGMMTTRDI